MLPRIVSAGVATALAGGVLALTPAAPASASPVCLDNGPVTYTPAPGAVPITVPKCEPIPTPLAGKPAGRKKPAAKYVKVCGRWWKRVSKGTKGAGTLPGRKGWYVLVRECRWVKR